jgi:hypothetical protein
MRKGLSMILKSGRRFSDKIMRQRVNPRHIPVRQNRDVV